RSAVVLQHETHFGIPKIDRQFIIFAGQGLVDELNHEARIGVMHVDRRDIRLNIQDASRLHQTAAQTKTRNTQIVEAERLKRTIRLVDQVENSRDRQEQRDQARGTHEIDLLDVGDALRN